MPATQPPASTGMRPCRSIRRPAGSAARAPAVRKIAGPSPRIPSIPVTSTSVTVATATASCTMPESDVSVAASRIVLRRIGKLSIRRSLCKPRAMQRRRVVVQGHVQGVFFRETTRRRALAAGVAGWVRNAADGSVEAVFEGEREAVDRLVAFAQEGPRGVARRLGRRRQRGAGRDSPGFEVR